MSLLDIVKCINLEVGTWFEKLPDHEMAAMTPEKLHEMFPGGEHADLRVAAIKLARSKTQPHEANPKEEVSHKGEEAKAQKGADREPSEPRPKKRNIKETLAYQKIVSGKTFGADDQLMSQMKKKLPNVDFVEDNKDHKITILFCPISSRIGADVTAAMSEVKDEKPILLVLMNHSHEPRCVATQRTWDDYTNIKVFVHVFYHETKAGLIKCQQNCSAIHRMQEELQMHCTTIVKDVSQAQTSENELNQHVDNESQCDQSAGKKSGLMNRLPSFTWGKTKPRSEKS